MPLVSISHNNTAKLQKATRLTHTHTHTWHAYMNGNMFPLVSVWTRNAQYQLLLHFALRAWLDALFLLATRARVTAFAPVDAVTNRPGASTSQQVPPLLRCTTKLCFFTIVLLILRATLYTVYTQCIWPSWLPLLLFVTFLPYFKLLCWILIIN